MPGWVSGWNLVHTLSFQGPMAVKDKSGDVILWDLFPSMNVWTSSHYVVYIHMCTWRTDVYNILCCVINVSGYL